MYVIVKGVESGNFAIRADETPNPFVGAVNINADGNWVVGSVALSGTAIYYFNVIPFTPYDIYLDDSSNGSGIYAANVTVSAYKKDGTSLFTGQDLSSTSPYSIYPNYNKVYIVVDGTFLGGTFAIRVVKK
jgi:hypothetical protein